MLHANLDKLSIWLTVPHFSHSNVKFEQNRKEKDALITVYFGLICHFPCITTKIWQQNNIFESNCKSRALRHKQWKLHLLDFIIFSWLDGQLSWPHTYGHTLVHTVLIVVDLINSITGRELSHYLGHYTVGDELCEPYKLLYIPLFWRVYFHKYKKCM